MDKKHSLETTSEVLKAIIEVSKSNFHKVKIGNEQVHKVIPRAELRARVLGLAIACLVNRQETKQNAFGELCQAIRRDVVKMIGDGEMDRDQLQKMRRLLYALNMKLLAEYKKYPEVREVVMVLLTVLIVFCLLGTKVHRW